MSLADITKTRIESENAGDFTASTHEGHNIHFGGWGHGHEPAALVLSRQALPTS